MKLRSTEEAALMQAIAAAEAGSIGELRVALVRKLHGDVETEARRQFDALGLAQTKGRSGVVLVVAPRQRQAAILGDVGVHAKVGDPFWRAVIDRAVAHFAAGDLFLGLLSAVHEIGEAFRKHLPAEQGEGNELPNTLHYD